MSQPSAEDRAAARAASYTQTQNDMTLGQVLDQGGPLKTKDISRAADKKKSFLNELLIFKINDSYGEPIPGCTFKIPRRKLSFDFLMTLIRRSPNPNIEIDYFLDSHGSPLWMNDLLLKGIPSPNFYSIVSKVRRFPQDIRVDPHYEGQTIFMISNVPIKSKDESTLVDEATLREWILCAILEEDPKIRPFEKDIKDAEEMLKLVDKRIKAVSKLEFKEEDGSVMNDQKAQGERELLYKAYGEERLQVSKRIASRKERMGKYIDWRKLIPITFSRGEIDKNTDTPNWFVRFKGTSDAKELEDLLIKKDDWAGINIAAGSKDPPFPPWVGRGPVPDGSESFIPDYTLLQVNVAGARFSRVPHGVGTIKELDRKSSNIYAERFRLFHGDWEAGKKTGHGLEVDDIGVFSGRFIEGLRSGPGRLDLADGTTITGVFGVGLQIEENTNDMFLNPYRDGEPHGEVDILFSDGAFYRGEMVNGRISGKGMYQSAFVEVMVGNFHDGFLHGHKGLYKNRVGETFKGDWDMGELNGIGFYENARKDTYEGFFRYTQKHGRGVSVFKNKGRYRGYYCNGLMTGKGQLEYGKKPKKRKKAELIAAALAEEAKNAKSGSKTARQSHGSAPASSATASGESTVEGEPPKSARRPKTVGAGGARNRPQPASDGKDGTALMTEETAESEFSKFKTTYCGFFLADNIMNGGIVMDTTHQIPSSVSRLNKRATRPILALPESIAKYYKGLRREVDKYTDMEIFIRSEMAKKKRIIFSQQKHFTKKTIYNEDTTGFISKTGELKGRGEVRKDRLLKADFGKIIPNNARIPRLGLLVSDEPITHLTKQLELIRPDPENGDVRQVKPLRMRVAMSDMEEAQERQRFLKYDQVWKRAEEAFVKRKKSDGTS